MDGKRAKKSIGIIGGGPSGLFVYKRLVESKRSDILITIFERKNELGSGMPYSRAGANIEHITNVSDNEIPEIVSSIKEWVNESPKHTLQNFQIKPSNFNEYKVVPRLFFGEYLSAQFGLLKQQADEAGIETHLCLKTIVTNVVDDTAAKKVEVVTDNDSYFFDHVIISTGHEWPKTYEGIIPSYFDSPYPPSKLQLKINAPIAIRGASLTAIDAIRTLSRQNGVFQEKEDGSIVYQLNKNSEGFRLVIHSRDGLLPAIRFHLHDIDKAKKLMLSPAELNKILAANNGFIPLDYLFETNFKEPIRQHDPAFYEKIKGMNMEEFVTAMMNMRERIDPFLLFKAEYAEAEKSIERRESVFWKEMIAVLSFTMNYPAKYFSAEDMMRLQNVLMPLISIVIAFVPQSSCRELIALYNAGLLTLMPVGEDSSVVPEKKGGATYFYTEDGEERSSYYSLFVDCIGQQRLSYLEFPFRSLVSNKNISPARVKFKSTEEGEKEVKKGNDKVKRDEDGEYWLNVPGMTINDSFQIVDEQGANNDRIYMMAVPYIGGYNPDYSGLDFCETASARIVEAILAMEISNG